MIEREIKQRVSLFVTGNIILSGSFNNMNIWQGPNSNGQTIGLGFQTLTNSISGSQNVAIGSAALRENISGSNNVAIGTAALLNNINNDNTAIGASALYNNTLGQNNLAIGGGSLTTNVGGSGNVGIGNSTLLSLNGGNSNIAIGQAAGQGITTGNVNTAIGSFSLSNGGSAQGNVAIGTSTMQYASGSDNVVIGPNAGAYLTGSKQLVFDNQDRSSNGYQNGSIIYGKMDSTVSNQTLQINAATDIRNNLVVSGSLSVGGNLQFNVGAFQSTQNQSGSANVSQSINYNTTDYSQGVSFVSGSRLTVANKGVYNIQFSAQLLADTGADDVYIWLKKNGTNVAATAGHVVLDNNQELIAAWNYVVDSAAGDYYELVWQSANGDAILLAETASGNIPSVPSIITTVTQVR
jgi:hypothetical protein